MANLVSPGVSVTVTDDSFFVPASAATVPLFFIATEDEKLQPDGITPAAGTFESNVVRTVTSLQQSTQLYGIPTFRKDYAGNSLHGDARNETGLLGLNKFLELGASAFAVRVNLNYEPQAIATKWISKMQTAGSVLHSAVQAFMDEYNTVNGYTPFSTNYKSTVNRQEVIFLAKQATADVFSLYSFKNTVTDFFANDIDQPNNTAGFQTVSFGGAIVAGSNPTGLTAKTYTATIMVDGVNKAISINGALASTFDTLVLEINNDLGSAASAVISNGNIKITSNTLGTSSTVLITDTNLFNSVTGYVALLIPTNGVLADQALPIFGNGFTNPPTGTFIGLDGIAEQWIQTHPNASNVAAWTPADAVDMLTTAAEQYQLTVEFLNKTSLGANDAARRVSIVTALNAVINSNTDVRSENFEYNLILCPGFYEVVDSLIALAVEVGEEAFVIADVPPTLSPEQAANWGLTADRQFANNVAYYYPGGLTSNLDGNDVYAAASSIALRTYTYSDNVSQVHFAPAGPRRGIVTGVSQMGYITGTLGTPTTFVATNLNVGQRNNLYQYQNNINPITEIPGRGILVMGQKTSAPAASALDRVNVVRMLAKLRRDLRKAAFSFLFEPNDQITRDSLKATADGVLVNLMVERGLYDFASVCDASNNTPDRIDRNELHLDIALKPVKAVEFIYIPIRVLNTGASLTN